MTLKPPVSPTASVPSVLDTLDSRLDSVESSHVFVGSPTGIAATDLATVQAAIDALPSTGGTLLFPRSTTAYLLSTAPTVAIQKKLRFVGVGSNPTEQQAPTAAYPSTTKIRYTGTGRFLSFAGSYPTNWCTFDLENIEIVGTSSATDCVYMKSAHGCRWRNFKITGFSAGSGVFIEGGDSQDNEFLNPVLEGNQYGARIVGTGTSTDQWTNVRFRGGYISNNSSAQIDATLGSTLIVEGTTILHTGSQNGIVCRGVLDPQLNPHQEMSGTAGTAWSVTLTDSGGVQCIGGFVRGDIVRSNQTSGTAMCLDAAGTRGTEIACRFGNPSSGDASAIPPVRVGASCEVVFGACYWNTATLALAAVDASAVGISAPWLKLVPYTFKATGVAASQTDAVMKLLDGIQLRAVPPRNSWLVGITYQAETAVTAGSLTVKPALDAASAYTMAVTSGTFQRQMRATPMDAGAAERVAANAAANWFQCKYTTNAAYVGPGDVVVTLWMMQNDDVTNYMF